MNKGKYIVIEGAEGVGKTTMVEKLAHRLRSSNTPVQIMREPDSQNDVTARTIRHLTQSPEYPMNTRTEVLLYNAARSQSLETVRNLRDNGVTCLVDRNYLTTLAIQYYGRGDVQDYQRINDIITFSIGDMEPDLTIVLDAPVTTLRERTKDRYAGERFDNLDEAFLERVRAGYLWEAKQRGLPVVYANEDIETVFQYLWQYVAASLTQREGTSPSDPQSVAEVLAAHPPTQAAAVEPPITETEALKSQENREKGQNDHSSLEDSTELPIHEQRDNPTSTNGAKSSEPGQFVTNEEGNVYCFTDEVPGTSATSALIELSRKGTEPRASLLALKSDNERNIEQLYQKAADSYNDSSIRQLVGQYLVVEKASGLMMKKLERGRLVSYIEQPPREVHFDQKDTNGHYRFYIPAELRGKLRSQYIRSMNQLFDTYAKLVADLLTYIRSSATTPAKAQKAEWRSKTEAQAYRALYPLVPVAATSTVGIYANSQAIDDVIIRLLSDELPEARTTGKQILAEVRKARPAFLVQADVPEVGGAEMAYRASSYASVKQLSDAVLPPNHTAENTPVSLISYTPHNELDILADMLYKHSDLPLAELLNQISNWPYQKKVDVFMTYIGERLVRRQYPGRALEKVHYSFDVVSSFGTFYDLQRHRIVDSLEWQALSPRLGYDVPKLVEEAGVTDAFEQCFDLSLQLYSTLQDGNQPLQAQYATLRGHKMRWKVTYNAREAFHLHELHTNQHDDYEVRNLSKQMHAKLAEVHPLLAEAMRFVNKLEDSELVRIATERYAEYKQSKLDSLM